VTRRSTRAHALLVAGAVLVTLLAGCGGGDDSGSRPDAGQNDTSGTVAPTTTATPTVTTVDGGVSLPRAFTAGHVVFSLTKVELSNATPGTYLDDKPVAGGENLLYVSFDTAYEPGFAGGDDEWAVANFKLVTAAGRTISASGVDFESSIAVSGSSTTKGTVVFPVHSSADVRGATFRLDDGTDPPAGVSFDTP
jgi:hypothetical protein